MSAPHYVPYRSGGELETWEFSTPLEVLAGFLTEASAQERAVSVLRYDRMLAAAAASGERKGKGPHARRLLAYFQQDAQEVAR
jgi:hypothetical protein